MKSGGKVEPSFLLKLWRADSVSMGHELDLLHLYEANPDKTRVLVERGLWRRPSATQGEITHAGVKLLREKGLWSPPAGMPLRYYEGAKKTKKENKMKKKSSDTRGTPTDEQLAAIRDYAAWAGRKWKDELRADWYRSGSRWPGEYYLLQQVRNNYGPEWLAKFKLEEPAARSRQGVKKHPDQRGSSTKKKSWRDVPLYHLDTGRALNEQERLNALREYRETNGMNMIVMAQPSGRNDPDEYDRALAKIRATPITRWRYRWEPATRRPHTGPILELAPEDIREDALHINLLDYAGLLHAAVKAVDRKVDRFAAQLAAQAA